MVHRIWRAMIGWADPVSSPGRLENQRAGQKERVKAVRALKRGNSDRRILFLAEKHGVLYSPVQPGQV